MFSYWLILLCMLELLILHAREVKAVPEGSLYVPTTFMLLLLHCIIDGSQSFNASTGARFW